MYHIFLRRWKREFRRLLVLRSEDYFTRRQHVLQRALGFLGLDAPADAAQWDALLSPAIQVAGPTWRKARVAMSAVATQLLREFYAPGLREVTEAMRDEPDAAEWHTWATSL
mmetsp:Transcript_37263/g.102850  ORF Transcript_37263/g.102850 Transcript_37263/m.102850 type:complete len:112 (-) Transcript_37263:39-374(-)